MSNINQVPYEGTGLKSSISGLFQNHRRPLANRRLQALGHLTAHPQVYVTKTVARKRSTAKWWRRSAIKPPPSTRIWSIAICGWP